jgi:predicted porin
MGQYYWGKGTATSNEQNDRTGWVAAGLVRIPGVEKLRLYGKMDVYDPNKDKSNNNETVYIAGISYDLSKEFMPFIAWERTDFEDPKKADTTMYQVGFQLKF